MPYTISPEIFAAYFQSFGLTALAATAADIPPELLEQVTPLIAAFDPRIVQSTLAVRAREVVNGEVAYDDAAAFVRALASELDRYLAYPAIVEEAFEEMQRQDHRKMN